MCVCESVKDRSVSRTVCRSRFFKCASTNIASSKSEMWLLFLLYHGIDRSKRGRERETVSESERKGGSVKKRHIHWNGKKPRKVMQWTIKAKIPKFAKLIHWQRQEKTTTNYSAYFFLFLSFIYSHAASVSLSMLSLSSPRYLVGVNEKNRRSTILHRA